MKKRKIDVSKYFEKPNLVDARNRAKTKIELLESGFNLKDEYKEIGKGKKFFIKTYGCQMNENDSEKIAAIIEEMGYTQAESDAEADFVLLNTCAVRENAENKVFGLVGSYKQRKIEDPDFIIGICGCMPQEEKVVNQVLEKYPQVDLIFGTHNIHRIPELLFGAVMSKEMVVEVWSKKAQVVENLPITRKEKHKAWVTIMYGCDNFCTYCIVPYTRGKERSRKPEDIIAEVRDLRRQGYKEVTLLGQNVNSYGMDFVDSEYRMHDLLSDLAMIDIPRIRFTTSNPWFFTDEMIDVIATRDNVMPYIHLPVQSGNTKILKTMGRRYTREEYLELFHKIKDRVKGATFTTDIIVGFPNETEEQFQDTLSIVEECKYDGAFTFVYSPREGTPAANMDDNVELAVKKDRLQRLNERVTKYAAEGMERYYGKVLKVLVDGVSKKNDQVLSGYSEENKLVNFPGSTDLIGEIVEVKIIEAKSWSLNGELL
jgi:tRNA-2-methylthio-N6-dimethylallyladenosine synthase